MTFVPRACASVGAAWMAVVLAGCDSADLRTAPDASSDAVPTDSAMRDDAGPDTSTPTPVPPPPIDMGPDDVGAPDADAASRPLPPAAAVIPTPPGPPPSPLGGWLASDAPTDLASADPRMPSGDPEPPRFVDCGTWRRVVDDGAEWCEPWPAGGSARCAGASEHFPGGAGCERIGSACPAEGTWDASLDGDPDVLFVRAGATGGNGTRANPFGTIAAALGAASATSTIALTAGTYAGPVTLRGGQTLVGACTEASIVNGNATEPAIRAGGATATVRNLTVRPLAFGLAAGRGTTLVIEDVLVEGGTESLYADGGMITATDVVARDPTNVGAHVYYDGAIALTRGVIRGSATHAVFLDGAFEGHSTATRVTLTEVALRSLGGAGVVSTRGGIDADGLVIEDAAGGDGIYVADGGYVRATKVVARDIAGNGLHLLSGTSSTLDSLLVERTGGGGVRCATPMVGSSWIVRDVATSGIASWVFDLEIESVRVVRAGWIGLSRWEGGILTARSIDVRESGLAELPGASGAGIVVTDHATMHLERSRITGARGAGLVVGGCIEGMCDGDPERMGVGTVATVSDLVVRGVGSTADVSLGGFGVLVTGGARGEITRAVVETCAAAELAVGYTNVGLPRTARAGELDLRDVMVRARDSSLAGLLALDGASVRGSGIVIADAHGSAIEARHASTSITLSDVVVADGVPDTGSSSAGRAAITSIETANVDISTISIARTSGTSVYASDGSALALADLRVAGSTGGPTVHAESGAAVSLSRATIDTSHGAAIDALGTDTSVQLTDVAIAGVARVATGSVRGVGIYVHQTARVMGAGVSVTGAENVALLVSDRDSAFEGADLILRGDADTPVLPRSGYLLSAVGGTVDVTRASLEDAHGIALGAFGGGSTITIEDLAVARIAERCDAPACVGTAIGSYAGGIVDVTRFVVRDASHVGAQLDASPTRMTLRDGVIESSPIGAEIPASASPTALFPGTVIECAIDVSTEATPYPAAPDPAL